MRALADAAAYFAPELEMLTFPAWDCLPYDRSSPSLRSTSERLATLHALQRQTTKPQLLVTTVNAMWYGVPGTATGDVANVYSSGCSARPVEAFATPANAVATRAQDMTTTRRDRITCEPPR